MLFGYRTPGHKGRAPAMAGRGHKEEHRRTTKLRFQPMHLIRTSFTDSALSLQPSQGHMSVSTNYDTNNNYDTNTLLQRPNISGLNKIRACLFLILQRFGGRYVSLLHKLVQVYQSLTRSEAVGRSSS